MVCGFGKKKQLNKVTLSEREEGRKFKFYSIQFNSGILIQHVLDCKKSCCFQNISSNNQIKVWQADSDEIKQGCCIGKQLNSSCLILLRQ